MSNVNPNHYKNHAVSPVDLIESHGLDFNLGCVVKYVARHKEKNGREDLLKGLWHLLKELGMPKAEIELLTESLGEKTLDPQYKDAINASNKGQLQNWLEQHVQENPLRIVERLDTQKGVPIGLSPNLNLYSQDDDKFLLEVNIGGGNRIGLNRDEAARLVSALMGFEVEP